MFIKSRSGIKISTCVGGFLLIIVWTITIEIIKFIKTREVNSKNQKVSAYVLLCKTYNFEIIKLLS